MNISEIMTKNVISVGLETTIAEVAKIFSENKISGAPVVDADLNVLGIITERDLLPKLKGVPFSNIKIPALFGEWIDDDDFIEAVKKASALTAKEVMSPNLVLTTEDDSVGKGASLMAQNGVKRLPVVRDGKLVGIVTRADFIKAIAK